MIRTLLVTTAAVIAGTTAAAAGGTIEASHSVLSSALPPQTPSVSIDDGPDHSAIVHAPPDTPVIAVSAGRTLPAELTTSGQTLLDITGAGEDTGLDVRYTGVDHPATTAAVERGAGLGVTPAAPDVVVIRAVLDGHALDTATLLRAALRGGGADILGSWTRPVDHAWLSQAFGCTTYAIEPVDRSCPGGHIHTGVDLASSAGTPVHAVLDGIARVVVSATGYGLHVVLDHGDGLTTLYAHLSSITVHEGDAVAAGDVIGLVGSSGNSTGPHLHFEVRRDGIAEDPTLDVAVP